MLLLCKHCPQINTIVSCLIKFESIIYRYFVKNGKFVVNYFYRFTLLLTQDVVLTSIQRHLNVMDVRRTLKQRCVLTSLYFLLILTLYQADEKLTTGEGGGEDGDEEIPHGADLFSAHDFDVQIDMDISCKNNKPFWGGFFSFTFKRRNFLLCYFRKQPSRSVGEMSV